MLNLARLAEQRGDWFKVVQKRNNAINAVLARAVPVPEPRPVDPTNDLEKLGDIYTPSKRNHDYLRHYWRYFRDVRLSARKVVQVGLQTPRSINMWEEFFPNATIYGLDIDPRCAEFAGGRKKVFIGDQTSEAFMMEFIAA